MLSFCALGLVACAKAFPGSTGGAGGDEGQGGDTGSGSGGSSGSGSGGSGGSSAGAGGATGTGGTGPAIVMKPPSTYPFNTAGASKPYPQGHAWTRCAFPLYNTDTIALAYTNWKTKFFVNGRVIRPDTGNDIVSEGIAYGMLIGVYMNDKPMFDTLWAFAQSKRDDRGLMHWHMDASGNVIGQGAATDADEDMAWALLMAGTQWGGTYRAQATTLIESLWNNAVESGSNVIKPGDNFGGAQQTNPSYFAPSYYRAFARVTPSHNWMAVVDSSYQILGAAAGQLGLVPNWVNSSGAGIGGPSGTTNGTDFGYDACRTPWRIALDYCENGEPRAKAYLDKVMAFFVAQTPNGIGMLKDGYTPTGANPSGALGDFAAGMAFFGPATVAAMSGQPAFLAAGYAGLETSTTNPQRMTQFTYFNGSWGILSLLAISGNFSDLTAW